MIQTKARLNKSRWIKRILQKGQTWQGKLLRVKFISYHQAGLRQTVNLPSFLSVVISSKTVSLATRRNRIKRRVREAFKPLLKEISGFGIVVFPRPEVAECNFKDIKEEARQCLKELR
jgi:ribonuclease P protein component